MRRLTAGRACHPPADDPRQPSRPRPARRPHRDDGRGTVVRRRRRRPRRADRRGRWRRCRARLDRAADPGRRAAWPVGDARASGTRTSIRSSAGVGRMRCDLSGARGLDAYLGDHRGVCRRAPRRDVDPRRRLVDGRLPGRHPPPRRPRSRRAGSAGLPREPRRPHGLGQLQGARAGRRDRRHAGPRRRPHRTRRRRPAVAAPSRRERSTSSYACFPRTRPTNSSRACAWPRPSSTRWASPTGRTPASRPNQARSPTRRSPVAAS